MTWAAATAKAKFSALLDEAESKGPQLIERRKKRYLVVTQEQWDQHTRIPEQPEKPFPTVADAMRSQPGYINDDDLFLRHLAKPLPIPDRSEPFVSAWDALRIKPEFQTDEDLFPRHHDEGRDFEL